MIISVDDIQQGDDKVFRQLFNEFYKSLCVFAGAYLNNNEQIADIVQETFVKFWERREDFNSIFQIKSFLYTVVRNRCLNVVRDEKGKHEDLAILESSEYFMENLMEEEAYRIFYTAVESLPPQTRNVIELVLEGYKYTEIAEKLKISENTVHTLRKLAYKKLKEILKDYYYLVFIFLP